MQDLMLIFKKGEGWEFKVPMTIGFISRNQDFELPAKRMIGPYRVSTEAKLWLFLEVPIKIGLGRCQWRLGFEICQVGWALWRCQVWLGFMEVPSMIGLIEVTSMIGLYGGVKRGWSLWRCQVWLGVDFSYPGYRASWYARWMIYMSEAILLMLDDDLCNGFKGSTSSHEVGHVWLKLGSLLLMHDRTCLSNFESMEKKCPSISSFALVCRVFEGICLERKFGTSVP